MMDLLLDTHFWYLVSFLVFATIVYKYGMPALLGVLDKRIEEIREELKNAEDLRVEAQEMLAQYQRKHKDAVKDADAILENAKAQAKEMQKAAEKELDEVIARREKQLEERVARMQQNAREEILEYASSLAIAATTEIIADQLDKKSNEKLVDAAIKDISKNIH
jgi:F-type H+-transporting ATPase subunit b